MPSSSPSVAPSKTPSATLPSVAPSATPSSSPSNSPLEETTTPSASPSLVPSNAPSTFSPSTAPSNSPSTSPIKSASSPTTSPSLSPSAQTTVGPSVAPSMSPSKVPTISVPTASPSLAPTTRTPSHSQTTTGPSSTPTQSPSRAPTPCQPTTVVDIIFVLDGSFSMYASGDFVRQRDIIVNVSQGLGFGASQTRMGFLVFAGPSIVETEPFYNYTIGPNLDLFDPDAIDKERIIGAISNLTALGGSTDTVGAINYVREHMFTDATKRPGSRRVVFLTTDGSPTSPDGSDVTDLAPLDAAVQALRDEDDVYFGFIRAGDYVPSNMLTGVADHITDLNSLSPESFSSFLYESILCIGPATKAPSSAPSTHRPSSAPGCEPNEMLDIIWMIDESSEIVDGVGGFPSTLDYVRNFADLVTMGPSNVRQGYVEWSGPISGLPEYQTIGNVLSLTDAAATDVAQFKLSVAGLSGRGGTLDYAGAFDYVRTVMLTNAMLRPGSKRVVILLASIMPVDEFGLPNFDLVAPANAAAQALKSEDNVRLAFLQTGDPLLYPYNLLTGIADYIANIGVTDVPSPTILGNVACTGAPTMAPTESIPVAPLQLNQDDVEAFNFLSTSLSRETWSECNKTGNIDPCDACYVNNEDHAIICAEAPISKETIRRRILRSPTERRIVGLRLRGVQIPGVVTAEHLSKFTALQELRLSSSSFRSAVQASPERSCADRELCEGIANCDLGDLSICSDQGKSGGFPVAAVIGIVFGLVALVMVLLILVARSRRRRSSSNNSRTRHPHREGSDGYEDSVVVVATGETDSRSPKGAASWERRYDNTTGAVYDMNVRTGEFAYANTPDAYEEPLPMIGNAHTPSPDEFSKRRKSSYKARSFLSPSRQAPPSQSEPNNQLWSMVMDQETGQKLWINNATGEFSWNNPAFDDVI